MSRKRELLPGDITQMFNDNDHALATIGNKLTARPAKSGKMRHDQFCGFSSLLSLFLSYIFEPLNKTVLTPIMHKTRRPKCMSVYPRIEGLNVLSHFFKVLSQQCSLANVVMLSKLNQPEHATSG